MAANGIDPADIIALHQSVARIEAKLTEDDSGKPKNWVEIITAFFVMIATILGIYTTVLAWNKDRIEIAQGPFSTEQAQLDVEKTRLEIDQLLADLNAQTASGLQQNDDAALDLIAKINAAVDSLAQASSAPDSLEVLLLFIFIYAGFWAIGIAQDTVRMFWQYVFLATHTAAQKILSKDDGRYRRAGRFLSVAIPVAINQVPGLFFLFLRLSLFATAVVPFLIAITQLTPIGAELNGVVQSMLEFHVFDAIRALGATISQPDAP